MKYYSLLILLSVLLIGCSEWQLATKELVDTSPPNKIWDKTLGGDGDDNLSSVVQTADGGFLLGGYSNSGQSGDKSSPAKGGYDYWVVRIDANGAKLWDKSFGGSADDLLNKITPGPNGSFLLCGYSSSGQSGDKSMASKGSSDFWVVKIDAAGNYQWDKSFGGDGSDLFFASIATTDGGFLLGGWSGSNAVGDKSSSAMGGSDCWLVKIDANGNKLWDKSFGGGGVESIFSIVNTIDGAFVLGCFSGSGASSGKSEASRGNVDFWVIKIDATGQMLWDKTIGGNGNDYLRDMTIASDGGFLLGGESNSDQSGERTAKSKGMNDNWVVKIDSKGNYQWDRAYGDLSGGLLYTLVPISKGGFLLGISKQNYWVVKIDANGNSIWDKFLIGTASEYLDSVIETADNGFLICGYSSSGKGEDKSEASKGRTDYWIVKLK